MPFRTIAFCLMVGLGTFSFQSKATGELDLPGCLRLIEELSERVTQLEGSQRRLEQELAQLRSGVAPIPTVPEELKKLAQDLLGIATLLDDGEAQAVSQPDTFRIFDLVKAFFNGLTPAQRKAFVMECFAPIPKRDGLSGMLDLDGAAQTVATNMVVTLMKFGRVELADHSRVSPLGFIIRKLAEP